MTSVFVVTDACGMTSAPPYGMILGVFSTKEKAEEHLKKCREHEKYRFIYDSEWDDFGIDEVVLDYVDL